MAEELQALLDRIQSDGVGRANEMADAIVSKAEKTAAAKIAEAERRCAEMRKEAEADAEVFRHRSEQAVKQAARDVVIDVGQSVQQTLERVLLKNVDDALDGDFLQKLLAQIVSAATSAEDAQGGIEVRVAPEQAEKLSAYARGKLAEAVRGGLAIAPDRDVRAGMRVMLAGGRVEHDFTDTAIMEAMSRILRPALAKLIFPQQ